MAAGCCGDLLEEVNVAGIFADLSFEHLVPEGVAYPHARAWLDRRQVFKSHCQLIWGEITIQSHKLVPLFSSGEDEQVLRIGRKCGEDSLPRALRHQKANRGKVTQALSGPTSRCDGCLFLNPLRVMLSGLNESEHVELKVVE